MSKGRICGKLLLLLGTFILLIIGVAFIVTAPEPAQGGKRLSEWLEAGVQPDDQTRMAVLNMGTKAIPCLLDWIQAKDSKLKQKINSLLDEQSWIELQFEDSEKRRALALAGFECLGELAKTAIPKLATLIEDAEIGEDALSALSYIGEPAVPVLIQALNDCSGELRQRAVEALVGTPLAGHPRLLSRLVELTYDPLDQSGEVQNAAIHALQGCKAQPQRVGLALAKVASDKGHRARETAIRSLHAWTTNADLTLPVFLAGVRDTNAMIRRQSVRGLAGVRTENMIELLDGCLKDPDTEVRAKAVATLGRVRNCFDEALSRLRQAQADPDSVVRAAAAGGLMMLAAARDGSANERCLSLEEKSKFNQTIPPTDLRSLFRIDEQAAAALGYKELIGCSLSIHRSYAPR